MVARSRLRERILLHTAAIVIVLTITLTTVLAAVLVRAEIIALGIQLAGGFPR